jgi:hypothetical protein
MGDQYREVGMNLRQPKFLLLATVAIAAATPALGQAAAPAAGTAPSATQGAASVPDFSGIWWHLSLPGFEPPAFAMIDLYGTPYTRALHVVERYRLLDYEDAKEGLDRDAKENLRPGGIMDRNYRGKYLQLLFTVEDEGVFTTPWSATITFGRGTDQWPETVCAENIHQYYSKDSEVPTADKPDF